MMLVLRNITVGFHITEFPFIRVQSSFPPFAIFFTVKMGILA